MSPAGSITHWLNQLKGGDTDAAQALWHRYFGQLVKLARGRLRNVPCRLADEEDVALLAFDAFCRGAANSRFPRLADRDDLWRLLVMLTARKAHALRDRELAQKRTASGHRDIWGSRPAAADKVDWDEVISRDPTPEFAASVAEECRRLFDLLQDPILRQIAVRKMEGCTNEEIACECGCVPRTIERKLRVIRSIWQPYAAL